MSVERGYFMTRGENVADVTAISVPLRVNNELLGLAVAGPSHRMDAQLDKQVQRLVDAQRRMRKEGIASS